MTSRTMTTDRLRQFGAAWACGTWMGSWAL
jgi:hypothetical protein